MNEWNGSKVAVIGLGVSNLPLIRFLLRHGASVVGKDQKSATELGDRYSQLTELGVELELGANYLAGLDKYDGIFLTPGMPKDLPEIEAIKGTVPLLSEMSLVLKYSKAPVLGITGSNGKTTTTTLVGKMLEAANMSVYVGGNIGTPLIEQIEDIPHTAKVVLEMSSFQLELLQQSPQAALITNISENHLDIHKTMDNYVNAKKHIFLHQDRNNVTVLNYDQLETRQMANECPGKVYYFSLVQPVKPGAYLADGKLILDNGKEQSIICLEEEVKLRGKHNIANLLAASLFSYLAGASLTAISQVSRNFAGVSHRLEKVLEYRGVTFYNDSIATSPQRAIAGINAFQAPIILIAGGYDKKLSFKPLANALSPQVKDLILLGDTAGKIVEAVKECPAAPPIHRVPDLAEAVSRAHALAKPGDIVLLSPACASFDMYPNYQARGEHFKELVTSLAEGENTK